jgi:hypothetical protein
VALLSRIMCAEDAPRRVDVRVASIRALAVVALAAGILVAATMLHGEDRETLAAWFMGMGEGILFAGLGVIVGEWVGAKEAAERLGACA